MKPHLETLEDRFLPVVCVTEFAIPTADSGPTAIAAGPDGNLWFTESDPEAGNRIGRITLTPSPLP